MSDAVMTEANIVIRGRKVVGGVSEGEALVTRDRISGWGGIDPRTGTVIETRHALRGQSFAGKVLVFPGAKGSSGWSAMFHMTRLMNTAPAAFLFNEMTTKMALGAVVTHAPAMTDFDRDPLACIETGDWVRVDADRGVVEITKKAHPQACSLRVAANPLAGGDTGGLAEPVPRGLTKGEITS